MVSSEVSTVTYLHSQTEVTNLCMKIAKTFRGIINPLYKLRSGMTPFMAGVIASV